MQVRLEGPADLFKVLGNDTRLRLLHASRRDGVGWRRSHRTPFHHGHPQTPARAASRLG
ncbi:MAG: hypothetical protein WB441_14310 [Nocardioidaceae bacterium]